MTTPSFSICITNYNYAEFVAATVRSALEQSYEPVEVVVVDDGSTDGSRAVLESFGEQITLICQRNAGQIAAARAALAASRGDFVIFLDSDDLLDRDLVGRAAEAFGRNPTAARVQWRMRVIGPNGEPTGTQVPPQGWPMPDGDMARHVIRRRTYVWPPTSGNAFPRAVVQQVLDSAGSDQDWAGVPLDLPLAEATPLLGPVVSLADTGGSYRFHHDNFSLEWRRDWTTFLHDHIEQTIKGHARLRAIAAVIGVDLPADPSAALDWAFIAYRLASVRLDARSHPVPGDRRLRLAARGIAAVLTQPSYPGRARIRRAVWMLALAAAPAGQVESLVERAYGRPFGRMSTETGA